MTAKLAETQLWQQNMASLIRSGLFSKADTGEMNGLYTVVGVYVDETYSRHRWRNTLISDVRLTPPTSLTSLRRFDLRSSRTDP